MERSLNIPLTQRTTHQIFWRVVRVFLFTFCAWAIVVATYRLFFTWNSVVPNDSVVHIRIIKSPKTLADLKSFANGIEIIPGIPWSLDALLHESRHVLNIAYNNDGSIEVILDRALTTEEQAKFSNFGIMVHATPSETILTNATTFNTLNHSIFYGIYTTLLARRAIRVTGGGDAFSAAVTKTDMTLHGFSAIREPGIESVPSFDTLLFASFTRNELDALIPRAFSQNTPGLANFFSLAQTNGLSAILRGTSDAIHYTFAIPITSETQSSVNESLLRSLGKELTEIPTIEGITDFLDDGSKTTALRSRTEAVVVLRDESPYRFLTATSPAGSVTLTQTPTHLTVTNITTTPSESVVPQCLTSASAFVRPSRIQNLLPKQTVYLPQTLTTLLWRTSTIAATSSVTRLCHTD